MTANVLSARPSTAGYAPDGSRSHKGVNTGPGGAWQWSVYLGADVEWSPGANVHAWTKHITPEAKRRGGETFFHHRDHLGGVRVITDAAGAETKRSTFTSFGDQGLVSNSAGHKEEKGYIGERADAETGLLYLNYKQRLSIHHSGQS